MLDASVIELSLVLFITSTLRDTTTAQNPLHECVFNGDKTKLTGLLESNDVDQKDKHGNTALHLAVMMGKKEFVDLLLEHDASVNVKNLSGWSPLSEAISYGDRATIRSLWLKSKEQNEARMNERRPYLLQALRKMNDFYVELKWNFSSWIPLLGRQFPSDLCKIQKRGASVRFDSTIAHFNGTKWRRGDVSFLFDSEAPPNRSLFILDNQGQVYQKLGRKKTDSEIENQVDQLMASEISYMELDTKSATLSRMRTGRLWMAKDKEEMVGSYKADSYAVYGLMMNMRKRQEHLSEKDLRKTAKIEESLKQGYWPEGNSRSSEASGTEVFSRENRSHMSRSRDSRSLENRSRLNQSRDNRSRGSRSTWSLSRENRGKKIQPFTHRSSLHPPPPCSMSWEDYIQSEPGKHKDIGRPVVLQQSKKQYKAFVAVSPKFPLSVGMLMEVLEVIAPLEPKQMTNLKEFLQMKLPPGFPVKLDIPVFPLVTANIVFQEFKVVENADVTNFKIPPNYEEDPKRFPDL